MRTTRTHKPPMHTLTVKIPVDLLATLTAEAEADGGRSLASYIRQILSQRARRKAAA